MQGNYADPKNTGNSDVELQQLDNTEKVSECQHSAFGMNPSTAPKTCLPKCPPILLQCQYCDYTTKQSHHLKTHSRKHTGENYKNYFKTTSS